MQEDTTFANAKKQQEKLRQMLNIDPSKIGTVT